MVLFGVPWGDVKAIDGQYVILVVYEGFFRSFIGYACVFELVSEIAAN